MSTQTLKMCDIDKCRRVADNTREHFLYTKWTDSGAETIYLQNIDLCGIHDYQYRSRIPEVHINGDNAHRSVGMGDIQ